LPKIKQSRDSGNKDFRLRHPRAPLRFLKSDEIYIITLLATLEQVVENSGGISVDLARLHKMSIEQTPNARVP